MHTPRSVKVPKFWQTVIKFAKTSLLALAVVFAAARAQAVLLVYEGYEYGTNVDLSGLDGGTGWLSPWQLLAGPGNTVGDTNLDVSLEFVDVVGNTLIVNGGRGFYTGQPGTSQPARLLPPRGTNTAAIETTWLSVLVIRSGPTSDNPTNIYLRGANLSFFNGSATEIWGIGNPTAAPTNNLGLQRGASIPNLRPSTNPPTPFNQVNFAVVRIDHIPGGNDNAYLWLNPILSVEPDTNNPSCQTLNEFEYTFDRVRPFAGNNQTTPPRPYAEITFDEIRMGTTFPDVAPFIPGVGKEVFWQGGVNRDWDILTANWLTNTVDPATTFAQGDAVYFDDSGLTNNINVLSTVFPSSLTVSNFTVNYLLEGAGTKAGIGGLTKRGTGTLTVAIPDTSKGAITLLEGTLQIGNGGSLGNLGSGVVANNAALIFNRSNDYAVNNIISGGGSVTLNGSGTVTLNNQSTYAGKTVVNNGNLVLNNILSGGAVLSNAVGTVLAGHGTNSGPVVVYGKLTPGPLAGGPGTFGANNLTLVSGATVTMELNTNNTAGLRTNDLIQVNGPVTLNNNVVTLRLLGIPLTNVAYRLMTNSGARTGTFDPTAPVANGHYTATLSNSANQINVYLNGPGAASLLWNSTASSTWENGGSLNWSNMTTLQSPDVFFDLDTVLFDDSATVTNISIVGTLVPSAVTVDNTVNAFTIGGTGKLTGAGSFTKKGSGTLVLNETGGNDFTGGFVISNGIVQVGNADAGGSLGNGPVQNEATLLFNKTSALNVPGAISGAGTLTQNGSGATTLGGSNTFTGNLTVNAGFLKLGRTNAAGFDPVIEVNSGGALVVGANITNSINLNGNATLGVFNADYVMSTNSELMIVDTNVIISADPQTPTTSRNIQVDGTLRGSGTILIRNADGITSPDGSQGVRFRGTLPGDFTGTIIVTNNSKSEIQVSGPGPFSPVNTGKFVIYAGAYNGGGGVQAPATGGYVEFNVRNTAGTTTIGNLFEILGTGAVVINGLGTGNGAVATLGDLIMSGGQELIGYRGAGGTTNTVKFENVTLTGGTVTFSPRSPIFGATNQAGTDFILNNVTETGVSSLVVNGRRNANGQQCVTLSGTIGYTGSTVVSNGLLLVSSFKTAGTGITVEAPGQLAGNGTLNENVTASGTLLPGDPISNPLSALTINGDLTLNANTNVFLLGQQNDVGASITGIQNLNVNGTATIEIQYQLNAPLLAGQTNTLFRITGPGACPGTNAFQIAPLDGFTFRLQTNVDGKSIDIVTVTAVKALIWHGLTSGGIWDHAANSWLQNGAMPLIPFTDGDFVTFQNSGASTVSITATLVPNTNGLINFQNGNYPFLLQGSGTITGSTGLRINPAGLAGAVTIANDNNFSGPVVLDNGSLKLGVGGTSGSFGTGNIIMTNYAGAELRPTPVTFHRSDNNLVISGNISGDIVITNLGTGMTTLTGNNSYTGGVFVTAGTIRIGTDSALGGTSNRTFVAGGATLDVGGSTNNNSVDIGTRPVFVSGTGAGNNGAIVNSSSNQQQNALEQVYLAGDTTFGGGFENYTWTNTGNPGRWDIRGTLTSSNAFLNTSNLPVKLTKIGSNQVSLVQAIIDPALGDVAIMAGNLAFEGATTMGNPDSNVTVSAGATLQFFQPNAITNDYTKVFVLNGDGVNSTIRQANAGFTTLRGTMSLSGPAVFEVEGNLTNTPPISGSGGLIKSGSGILVQSGIATYTGNTAVRSGILMLTGSASLTNSPVVELAATNGILDVIGVGGALVRGSDQTIQGNGTLRGTLTVNSGGTNSPGLSIGTLTVTNAVNLNAGSTTVMEINPAAGQRDRLVVGRALQYGGTLTILTNGALAAGTFQLFSANSFTGTFSATNRPTLPAPYYWTNFLVSGAVTIGVASPYTNASILSVVKIGNNVVLHGTNNHGGQLFRYNVLTSTNLSLALTNWTSLATNSFNVDGTFDFTNGIDSSQPRLFYGVKVVP